MAKGKKKDKYRDTLMLPKTSFNMRAGLLALEPKLQERWAGFDLYRRTQDSEHPSGKFVFHDGPPYANGSIHLGHLLNKILKDLVVRSRQMAGFEVSFVPGWDCHGLPIEHKVLKELGREVETLSTEEVRRRCGDYAARYMELQAEQLKRLGTLADYDAPYYTMDPKYEGAVLDVFTTLVTHGLPYRDLKPVHWSIENRTALAEAELEYYDREDVSVFVLLEVSDPSVLPAGLSVPDGASVDLMIWTTTPWTLPANLAVAVAANADYGLFRVSRPDGDRYVVLADGMQQAVLKEASESLGRVMGSELVECGATYRHPFIERTSPLVRADYVTLSDGTGLVHTAPGHGAEDYHTGMKEGLPIYCPVRGDGTFDDTVPEWIRGVDVWTANGLITERLRESGHLFRDEAFTHSYPHDWRGKTPTIFRATEQWFIAVDKPYGEEGLSLRDRALRASGEEIGFVPEWGQNRLRGMVESRPDWCISRQRKWGLPIPAFVTPAGDNLLTPRSVKVVADYVREHGSDAWFTREPAEILAAYDPAADPDAPEGTDPATLAKGGDIFDVWFESGSSWNGVLNVRDIGYPADLYLEGSDQHRGWFQLSLLLGLGMTGVSPFKTVLTHGFMVTGRGEKMSKSLGNTIEVETLLEEYGADICRWWTASLDYTRDIKVEWDFFKLASEEYRKVRNTIRFLMGNLADFDPGTDTWEFTDSDRTTVDWWAREEYARVVREVRDGYETYQFKKVRETLFNYCNDSLSAVYMAAVKDRMYCDAADSPRRRRTQTVMREVLDGLIRLLAPVLVHTADEAWLAVLGDAATDTDCVHLARLPEAPEVGHEAGWDAAMALRDEVLKVVEDSKESIGFRNPLDAGVVATVTPESHAVLLPFAAEMADLCGVSRFDLVVGEESGVVVADLREEPSCERSWRRDVTVRERGDGAFLSDRDAAVLGVE